MSEQMVSEQDLIAGKLAALPYAVTLGVEPVVMGEQFTLVLPYRPDLIGNPALPALHGGAIGGFMELTAIIELMRQMEDEGRDGQPKPIGISVDYLRRGRPETSYARARVARMGGRVANVRVTAWQSREDKPIATLHGNFLLPAK